MSDFGRSNQESVHLTSFPEPVSGVDLTEEERYDWERMLSLRQLVAKALEEARETKRIGSSLESMVTIDAPEELARIISAMEDPEGFFIVSRLEIRNTGAAGVQTDEEGELSGVRVTVSRAQGSKCPRCWIWSPEIGTDQTHPDVCPRCAGVLAESGIAPTNT
jgi:isoleucyl-tRNA synthetase